MRAALTVLTILTMLCYADILFEDDFDDGNADGWIELVAGPVYEVNGLLRYEMSFSSPENVDAVAANSDIPGQMSVPDYSILVEILAHDPCDEIAACTRVTVGGPASTGYLAMLRFDIGEVSIKRFDGSGWINLAQTSFSLDFEELYWLRFECVGDSLLAKVWQGTSGDEPAEWLLTISDGTYAEPGYFALLAAAWGGGSYDGEFDNVCVSTPTLSLISTTWSAIKAYFW